MKTALIVLAVFVGFTILIVGMKGIMILEKVAPDLARPAVIAPPTITTTRIEYLEITTPDDVKIIIRGLQSEMDSRVLLLWAEAQ